ncbi:MAG TPA: hypothetical protein VF516_20595, partial [Kofleriaceae bacterium]
VLLGTTVLAVGAGVARHEAITRAPPSTLAQHLAKNFPDGQVAWLMKDAAYETFVVKAGTKNWGRCDDTNCYVVAAPAGVIHAAVTQSMHGGRHDPAALGKALGIPAANVEGPLRMITLDAKKSGVCARLPVESDPGIWKCRSPEDTDCFKVGGYTSGGLAELMIINAPVDKTTIEDVQ